MNNIIQSNHVTLIPLEIRLPNAKNIYAPAKFQAPKRITRSLSRYQSSGILVSLADDGISNPQPMTAYGFGLHFWYIISPDL